MRRLLYILCLLALPAQAQFVYPVGHLAGAAAPGADWSDGLVISAYDCETPGEDVFASNDLTNSGVSTTGTGTLVGDACVWDVAGTDELRLANASAGDFLFDDVDFTICALLYPDIGASMHAFGVSSGTSGSYAARMTGGGGGRFDISTDGSNMTLGSGPDFSDETWASICISYDSSDDLWLRAKDGDTTPNQTAHSGGAHGESALDFVVGNDDNQASDWSGMIDEIWILSDSITDIFSDTGVHVQECHWNSGSGRAFSSISDCNP